MIYIKLTPKKFLLYVGIFLVTLGLVIQPSFEIFNDLKSIVTGSAVLISDYFVEGSVGSAFLNSGLITLIAVSLLYLFKVKVTGIVFASVFIMSGFALFGKNIFNIWSILLGCYLYARYAKIPFGDIIHIAFFATSIAPIVSEIMFVYDFPLIYRFLLSHGIGLSMGFVIVPLSRHLFLIHKGYNLYNIGFSIGILSTLYVSALRSYGFIFESRLLWYDTFDLRMYTLFITVFLLCALLGFFIDKQAKDNYKQILNTTGYLDNDYLVKYGLGATLINCSMNGILCLVYLMLIKVPLNGPSLGGVLTVFGFGASGKHVRNILPIFVGVYLGSLLKTWSVDAPSIVFAALFGTALAPVAGEYGFLWGVVASFINSSVVLNTGFLHGGLNLYNTGFSIGIVTAVLVPVLESFVTKKSERKAR